MKIALFTHGKLAEGLLSSFEMIVGNPSNIVSLSLTDEGIQVFSRELHSLLDKIIEKEQVLILCDMKGGTPYNESLKYYLTHKEEVEIVTGVNLPMLMETSLIVDQVTLEEAQNTAIRIGKESVEGNKEEDSDSYEENYDIEF